jgi:hypothetical protein
LAAWSFASAFAGAALAGLAAVAVQFFKYHIDGVVIRCSDLITSLRTIGDLSSEYWISEFNVENGLVGDEELADGVRKGRLLEARILGYQKLILQETHALCLLLPKVEAEQIGKLRPKFIDAVSGADFGDRDGSQNYTQAVKANVVCADMVHVLQSAKSRCASISYVLQRIVDHKIKIATSIFWHAGRK